MRDAGIAVLVSIIITSVVPAADYFPLQEGNVWTYTMSNGMEMSTKIAGFGDVGGVHCAIVESTAAGQTSREYVAADAQGLKAYMTQGQGQEFRYDPPVVRVKLPYKQGDTWTAAMNYMGTAVNTTFESVGTEPVQTPVGTFECIKVRATMAIMAGQPPMVSTIYYAPGLGPARQVMQMMGQELTATLTSTTVRPAQQVQQAPSPTTPTGKLRCPKCEALVDAGTKFCPQCGTKLDPPATAPTNCPKCNAKLPPGAKFCPTCGEKIAASAVTGAASPTQSAPLLTGSQPALEKYQSADGKVLLYKPRDWQVKEGDIFGQGTYGVTVMEPQEDAVVLFITFPVTEEIKDSVALSAKCIAALREEFPDLQVANMNSTPERERTVADITLTDEGEKGTGHAYFFRTQSLGSVYILLAKAQQWTELRPTLVAVAANLAYAPQGVGAVQEQCRQRAAQASATQAATTQTPAAEGFITSPIALIKRASQRPARQVPLQAAALPDGSLSLQIPQGWTLEGGKIQYVMVDNPQTRTHGMGYVSHTIIPMDMAIPGTITAPYQPPPQAMNLLLQMGRTGTDVQILAQCPAEQLCPEIAQAVQQMRAQGQQVDARLMHVRFRSVATGQVMRGVFNVQCCIGSMTPVWQIMMTGSWAPDNEFDEWLPLYLQLEKTPQVNQQWMGQEMGRRAVRQQQANRDLSRSIAESNQAFDGVLESMRNADRSRDYIAHMWSETTLGQGTWVAENEGARVYQTDSWGIQGPEGSIDSPAYNTTNFTGENPWGGSNLDMVDTRAEYERYIVNQ